MAELEYRRARLIQLEEMEQELSFFHYQAMADEHVRNSRPLRRAYYGGSEGIQNPTDELPEGLEMRLDSMSYQPRRLRNQ